MKAHSNCEVLHSNSGGIILWWITIWVTLPSGTIPSTELLVIYTSWVNRYVLIEHRCPDCPIGMSCKGHKFPYIIWLSHKLTTDFNDFVCHHGQVVRRLCASKLHSDDNDAASCLLHQQGGEILNSCSLKSHPSSHCNM